MISYECTQANISSYFVTRVFKRWQNEMMIQCPWAWLFMIHEKCKIWIKTCKWHKSWWQYDNTHSTAVSSQNDHLLNLPWSWITYTATCLLLNLFCLLHIWLKRWGGGEGGATNYTKLCFYYQHRITPPHPAPVSCVRTMQFKGLCFLPLCLQQKNNSSMTQLSNLKAYRTF